MTNNNNIHGYVGPGWDSVRAAFEQNFVEELDIGASVCVYYRGECVVDLCGGWKDPQTKQQPYTSDTLQLVFSVSKGVMASAIALCVERGWLDYDAPVAKYWPEFAANGKQVHILLMLLDMNSFVLLRILQ
jgi:CubicO group peptidase (beta-lactamase class C family)